jgi:ABC-type hemin transport system substrate-binding protein
MLKRCTADEKIVVLKQGGRLADIYGESSAAQDIVETWGGTMVK